MFFAIRLLNRSFWLLLEYEVIWGILVYGVEAVRSLSRSEQVKILAGPSPNSPMRRRLPILTDFSPMTMPTTSHRLDMRIAYQVFNIGASLLWCDREAEIVTRCHSNLIVSSRGQRAPTDCSSLWSPTQSSRRSLYTSLMPNLDCKSQSPRLSVPAHNS